ncbi:methyltransferase domain-containing protein [Colletotrichum graminicola]|uniref:Methyltransferase domain-containing protein n=1 Tax=Colletotrichum graminicola (strain M1.001 / M2 / FGSC 10212) TaxID=645133 RepID=E3QGY6_COLGM|nr:methyltransferase domain-containing protein [Colletotrichum graminicola M1.001]EFQ30124.1 methyltransferase domain-containing protein [Colletotrichum graminicola M1.001]WDK09683.1 methyltransferase domain-containing protein [Colletotrichum graminicola]
MATQTQQPEGEVLPADQTQQPEEEDPWGDDGVDVGDSADDGSVASVRSSIMDYRRENGRTYHRHKDGKYVMPNDEREQDRLDLAHNLWLLTWDDKLCNCPKVNGAKRVLDVGTGTGIWAMDYADEHPEASVIGVDLSPIQSNYVPPNCSFQIDDIEEDWTWSQPFDFIFFRSMTASFADWPDTIAQAYENLEPGGYIELQDTMFPLKCQDGPMPDDWAPNKWSNLLVEASVKGGRPNNTAASFKKMLEDAGFVDVVERKAIWPFNPWPKDKKLNELGLWCQHNAFMGIEAASMAVFTRVLGWTAEETTVFCAEVRNEHKKIGVQAYYDIYSVWGRKPEKEDETDEA